MFSILGVCLDFQSLVRLSLVARRIWVITLLNGTVIVSFVRFNNASAGVGSIWLCAMSDSRQKIDSQ